MNILAIALVLTSLLTTVVQSHPTPQDDFIMKPKPTFSGPRDLICDAYGKCTHKIANALVQARAKVTKSAHRVSDKAKELTGDATDIVRDGASKEFDVVDSPKRMGEDIAGNATDGIAEHVNEKAKRTVKNAQEIGQIRSLKAILFKLKEVTYDVVRNRAYMLYRDKMDTYAVVGLIHMLGFSTAYGMCVWVTFVSSYILGRCLPRQMFGMVQSRIYPVYFKAMGYCVSAALLGHLVSQKSEVLTNKMGVFQSLCLLSALVMVLTNMMMLEPKATKAMYERMKTEKEGKDGGMMDSGTVVKAAAEERRDVLRLNAYSSALNLSTLVVLTWHIAYMGQLLQAAL